MFKVVNEKGFQIKFENGLTISVMFGSGNYCANRTTKLESKGVFGITESMSAEIAIFDQNDVWFEFGADTVKGWVGANEVGEWIVKVKNATSLKDIKQQLL